MLVKELKNILNQLDENAVIDMASDEEGNSFGEIDKSLDQGILQKTGEKVYTIFPMTTEMPEERYEEEISKENIFKKES